MAGWSEVFILSKTRFIAMVKYILLVGLGGGIGSISRYLLHRWVYHIYPDHFPWAFVVDLPPSLLLPLKIWYYYEEGKLFIFFCTLPWVWFLVLLQSLEALLSWNYEDTDFTEEHGPACGRQVSRIFWISQIDNLIQTKELIKCLLYFIHGMVLIMAIGRRT